MDNNWDLLKPEDSMFLGKKDFKCVLIAMEINNYNEPSDYIDQCSSIWIPNI